jgi:uncharacterized protein
MTDNHPKAGPEVSRRGFLKAAAIAGASAVLPAAVATAVETDNETTLGGFQTQKRPLGSTGLECSILGVGGFHLGTVTDQAEVNNMVAKAIDHGINMRRLPVCIPIIWTSGRFTRSSTTTTPS